VFKPWWNAFRGVAKRNIYQYLSEYSFGAATGGRAAKLPRANCGLSLYRWDTSGQIRNAGALELGSGPSRKAIAEF